MNTLAFSLLLASLWPQPRVAEPAPETQIILPCQIIAAPEFSAPAALLRRELTRLFGPQAVAAERGRTIVRLIRDPRGLPHAEEYAIEPGAKQIVLRAHDLQGAFWAGHRLAFVLTQARRAPNGYVALIPKLRDWPESPLPRAFLIQGSWPGIARNADELAEIFKRNLELLARLHIPYFALEFGSQIVPDFDPALGQGVRFSKKQAKEIIDYGRSLGLKPIGYLNLLAHLDRAYNKAPYTQNGGLDIRSEETYEKFVYPLLAEMLDVYGPIEYFHAGMDEANELFAWLAAQGEDGASLLARHIERLNNFLKARGVKLVIWHDMLLAPRLQDELEAPVGPANGGPPCNTAAALTKIPRDVILDYWFYDAFNNYPALDYLQKQGFTVWASPWTVPFSLVRYAQARGAPTMGTIWAGPPSCFASPRFSPVTALYAQAAWNATQAPASTPEEALTPAAQQATNKLLWSRRTLQFPGRAALLLSPSGPRKLSWPPPENVEQYYGVPFDLRHPLVLPPLPHSRSKPLTDASQAAYIVLQPSGRRLSLDGVNTSRGEGQLILYCAPRPRTGTNQWGIEIAVSAQGEVLEISSWGPGDAQIPPGGFVLSAHYSVSRAGKAYELERLLRPGDRVSVLNKAGEWIGGWGCTHFSVERSDGLRLSVDGVDMPRGQGQLILYQPGYGEGYTRTNQFGVEAIIQQGRVVALRDSVGNSAIPANGYVLSAHDAGPDSKAALLRQLQPGATVRLLVEYDDQRDDAEKALAERRRVFPVNALCTALYLATNIDLAIQPGTSLGAWEICYASGETTILPLRFGYETVTSAPGTMPHWLSDKIWLIEQPECRCLVQEWRNPSPQKPVREIRFLPSPLALNFTVQLTAATAAVP